MRDEARILLKMAKKDLKAMKALKEPSVFEPETFGFHAQQAAEKGLKSWLIIRDVPYPPTHNLRYLIELLEKSGCEVSGLWDFLELNPFAVQFRYEAYEEIECDLDVDKIIERIENLLKNIDEIL